MNVSTGVLRVVQLATVIGVLLLLGPTTGQAHPFDTSVGGPVVGTVTWTASGNPYIVANSVLIMPGATLIIEPGVIVKIDSRKGIWIQGELRAQGTEESPIVFTANSQDPAPGHWDLIRFEAGSVGATYDPSGNYVAGSILRNVIVEYGGGGTSGTRCASQPGALTLVDSEPAIDRVEVRHSAAHGVVVDRSGGLISASSVHHNAEYGIAACSFTGRITGTEVFRNGNMGLGAGTIEGSSTRPRIDNNKVHHNGNSGVNVGGDVDLELNEIYLNRKYGVEIWCGEVSVNPSSVLSNTIAYNGRTGISDTCRFNPMDNPYTIGHPYGTLIENNRIAHNSVFGSGENAGGIFSVFGSRVSRNSIVYNAMPQYEYGYDGPGVGINFKGCRSEDGISHNTIVGQQGISWDAAAKAGGVYLGDTRYGYTIDCAVHHNNIYGNDGYDLFNANAQSRGTLNAQQNYWGTSNPTEIMDRIWDFFDDASLAVTDTGNPLTSPALEAPPAPPTGVVITEIASAVPGQQSFQITWDANQEANIAGYRLYYDLDGVYPWDGTGAAQGDSGLDVGNATSYILSGLPPNQRMYVTVQAYNVNGAASWYALGQLATHANLPLRNGDFELGPTGIDWIELPARGHVINEELSRRL